MNENVWSYVGVTHNTFSITFLTQASKRNAWLFSAENKVRMMLGHSNAREMKPLTPEEYLTSNFDYLPICIGSLVHLHFTTAAEQLVAEN
jgi:hypothetical protein